MRVSGGGEGASVACTLSSRIVCSSARHSPGAWGEPVRGETEAPASDLGAAGDAPAYAAASKWELAAAAAAADAADAGVPNAGCGVGGAGSAARHSPGSPAAAANGAGGGGAALIRSSGDGTAGVVAVGGAERGAEAGAEGDAKGGAGGGGDARADRRRAGCGAVGGAAAKGEAAAEGEAAGGGRAAAGGRAAEDGRAAAVSSAASLRVNCAACCCSLESAESTCGVGRVGWSGLG